MNIGTSVRHVKTTKNEINQRLDRFIKIQSNGAPTGLVNKWIRTGQVRIDGKRAKGDTRLLENQDIRLPPMQLQKAKSHSDSDKFSNFIKSLVIFEDESVIVLNKPQGIAVQGGTKTTNHIDAMLPALAGKGQPPPRLVHRLDKDTSGVLLLARTLPAARALGKSFKEKDAKKLYWAITCPCPENEKGSCVAPLEKGGGIGKEKMRVVDGGQRARTDYEVLDKAGDKIALVGFSPKTGRTHQIRAHAAYMGFPILGDGKYGGEKSIAGMNKEIAKTMHLHARRICVPHPSKSGQEIDVTAKPPTNFIKTLKTLGLFSSSKERDEFI